MSKFSAYVRVSRMNDRDATSENFISTSEQLRIIKAKATQRGHDIEGEYEDLDQSGGTMQRPGLDQVLAAIREGRSDGLIVAYLDRFARTVSSALDVIDEIQEAGGKVIFADLDIDTTTETGELMLTILLAVAKMYREQTKRYWKASRRHAVERGVFPGSYPPAGYDRGDDGRLVPNKDAALIRAAFELRLNGGTLAEVRRLLDGQATLGNGSTAWSRTVTAQMLARKTYTGALIDGDVVNPSAHEPIISEATWNAAQRVKGKTTYHAPSGRYLLQGIIRCAGCRYTMTGEKGNGQTRPYYRCGKQGKAGCSEPTTIKQAEVEEFVLAAMADRLEGRRMSQAEANDEAAELDSRLGQAREELDRLVRLVASGVIAEHEAPVAFAETRERIAELEDERAQLLAPLSGVPELVDLAEYFAELPAEEQQAILRAELHAVFVKRSGGLRVPVDTRCRLVYRDQASSVELPKKGGAKILGPVRFDELPA